jgi:hypothetical protein
MICLHIPEFAVQNQSKMSLCENPNEVKAGWVVITAIYERMPLLHVLLQLL